MNEQLVDRPSAFRFYYAAAIAVLFHLCVMLGWSRLSVEQNAYATGTQSVNSAPGMRVTMLSNFSQPAAEQVVRQEERPKEIIPRKLKPEIKKTIKRAENPVIKSEPQSTPESVPSGNNSITGGSNVNSSPGNLTAGPASAEPDYLNNPTPKYPTISKRLHEEGAVILHATISSVGRVQSLTIKHSSGFERLDDAAFKAVQNWKFKPAILAGIAIDSEVEIPVRFSLRN